MQVEIGMSLDYRTVDTCDGCNETKEVTIMHDSAGIDVLGLCDDCRLGKNKVDTYEFRDKVYQVGDIVNVTMDNPYGGSKKLENVKIQSIGAVMIHFAALDKWGKFGTELEFLAEMELVTPKEV